ncbi:hypothetical protein CR513_09263, partial [Mucuna pruriens]
MKTWVDLAEAFLQQYRYNEELAPDQTHLQNMAKKVSETFKEYAQRWREVVAHVQPSLSDKEMVTMFIETLQSSFFIGERIEIKVRSRKISQAVAGAVLAKKGPIAKDSHYHLSSLQLPTSLISAPYLAGSTLQSPPTSVTIPKNNGQNYQLNSAPKRNPRVFTPIPMSYSKLLQHMLRESLVTIVSLKPLLPPYPKNYDPNAKCDYHARAVGRSTEKCWSLKHKVQDLEKNPNISNNPLPEHGNPTIGAIFEEDYVVDEAEKIRTPMKFIFRMLQSLMDKGLVQVGGKGDEVVIVHQEG